MGRAGLAAPKKGLVSSLLGPAFRRWEAHRIDRYLLKSGFRKKHTLYKKPPHKCFNTQLKRTHTKTVCIVECVYWFYFLLQKHPCAVQFLVWSQHTWTIHNLVCGKNLTCCVAFKFLLHQHSWAVHLLVWSQHTWTIHNLVFGKNWIECGYVCVFICSCFWCFLRLNIFSLPEWCNNSKFFIFGLSTTKYSPDRVLSDGLIPISKS